MKSSDPTGKARVLRALKAVGPRGITAVDFNGSRGTPDGLKPITRLAARIAELRHDGHEIVSAGKRDACKVYVLKHEAWEPVDQEPAEPPERLFQASVDAIRGEAA